MKKNSMVVTVLIGLCVSLALFAIMPTRSSPGVGDYDPWYDVNDDGVIDGSDIIELNRAYGSWGTPIAKACLEYDSGWINITDKRGKEIVVWHGLNSSDVTVDITGKTTDGGGQHQRHFGSAGYTAEFSKTYGRIQWDVALASVQTGDGGYTIAGYTESFGAGGSDFWLVKTDVYGNALWNKTYGGTSWEFAYALVQTDDGGYALAGVTDSYGVGNGDFWLVKTDADGNALWNKTYGGTINDEARALVQTDDGGYAIAGTTSHGAGSGNSWLVKTDTYGNMLWNKTYGGTSDDRAYALIQTGDGGYAIAGYTESYGAGSRDVWLVKTDAAGNAVWNQTYGGTNWEEAYDLAQTGDGGYVLAGITTSYGVGNGDFWLVKTDANGNAEWNQTYGGTGFDWAYPLVQTSDSGYAIAGQTCSWGAGSSDFWLVKTDADGNALWNKTYGGLGEDCAYALVQTNDGGYAMAGTTSSYGDGGRDVWLVKTDAYGNAETGPTYGLSWVDSTADSITLYRGSTDPYWNYVRVRVWKPR